jgi:hypothetical protein
MFQNGGEVADIVKFKISDDVAVSLTLLSQYLAVSLTLLRQNIAVPMTPLNQNSVISSTMLSQRRYRYRWLSQFLETFKGSHFSER